MLEKRGVYQMNMGVELKSRKASNNMDNTGYRVQGQGQGLKTQLEWLACSMCLGLAL